MIIKFIRFIDLNSEWDGTLELECYYSDKPPSQLLVHFRPTNWPAHIGGFVNTQEIAEAIFPTRASGPVSY